MPADAELARWLRKTVVPPTARSSSKASPSSADTSSPSSSSSLSSSSGGCGPRRGCQVVLAANKCERRGGAEDVAAALAESVRFGFGEPVALSAMSGEGMADLYEVLQPLLDPIVEARQAAVQEVEGGSGGVGSIAAAAGEAAGTAAAAEGGTGEAPEEASGTGGLLRIAVMGLPNVVS